MRIIAGKHRGLTLKSFDFDGTRPTSDKVREAIFSKIQFNIVGRYCLDLFGGTGAITLELLSRGADKVVVCDNNIKSINLIKENATKCRECPIVIKSDFKSVLNDFASRGEKFDIIFLDPPYKSDYGNTSIQMISNLKLLNDDGIIIYESDKNSVVDPCDFELYDEKVYGTIKVSFLRKV